MHGFLNINKPSGITSRAAVDLVRHASRNSESQSNRSIKVGHTGTLDPIACGVLVICVGKTTRLADYVQQMPKSYRATFLLDRKSETDDTESDVEMLESTAEVSEARLRELLSKFVGAVDQIPPKFSAAKVDGRRAYKLARRKTDFELQPRKVTIYEIELLRFEYPEFQIDVRCGAGTYIRSLGRDIAAELGTCAVMSSLVRTSVGDFDINSAVDPASLDLQSICENLLPPVAAVKQLPKVKLSDDEISELRFGRGVQTSKISDSGQLIAGLNQEGELVSLLKLSPGGGEFRPFRNFNFA